MAIQAPKMVQRYISWYDHMIKHIKMLDDSVLLNFDRTLMQSTFGLPDRDEFCDINFGSSASMYNEKRTLR